MDKTTSQHKCSSLEKGHDIALNPNPTGKPFFVCKRCGEVFKEGDIIFDVSYKYAKQMGLIL